MMDAFPQRALKRRRGLTLIEAMTAAVVLSIAVIAVSQALVAGQMQTYDALHRQRAMALADALIEEIVRLPYVDPDETTTFGPDPGESTRAAFDDVNDFHGFTQSAGALSDAAGVSYDSNYQQFSRSVTIAAGSQTVSGFGAAYPGVTVQVTVTDSAGTSWTVTTFVPEPP